MLLYNWNWLETSCAAKQMTCAQFCYLVCGVLASGNCYQVQRAVADPLPKHLLFVGGVLLCNCYQVLEGGCSCLLVEFSCATVTKSLKEAVAVCWWSSPVQLLPSP